MDMHIASTQPENPLAVVGSNGGPADPFLTAEKRINDLYGECKLWLDGAVVDTEGLAEGIGTLLNNLRTAVKEADAARVDENKPFDEGKAAVQAKYADLIADTKTKKGKAIIAMEACKRALAPWLVKKEREQAEAAAKARREAEEAAWVAQEALRASDAANLTEREAAEEMVQAAKIAERVAVKAGNTTAKVANAGGRAVSLRTVYTHTLDDPTAFARYVWGSHKPELVGFLDAIAKRLVDSGKRELPGVTVHEERRAV